MVCIYHHFSLSGLELNATAVSIATALTSLSYLLLLELILENLIRETILLGYSRVQTEFCRLHLDTNKILLGYSWAKSEFCWETVKLRLNFVGPQLDSD